MSRELGEILRIPVYHLDRYFWKPGWVEDSKENFDAALAKLLQEDAWIMDGNYGRTFPERLKYADTVIFLKYPRALCLRRVLKRYLDYRGRTRPDLTEGCPERLNFEFLRYIWTYNRKMLPRMERYLKEAGKGCRLYVFDRPEGTEAFLRCLKQK